VTRPELAEVFQLMAEAQDRRQSFTALLVISAEESGALAADRAERQRELRQYPEMIEQPPMRRRLPGHWRHHVSVRDGGEVSSRPRKHPTTPAGWPGASGDGPLELMLRPWRLLAGYQFDERVDEIEVSGRECWLLRGETRIAEPIFDHFVERWALSSDAGRLSIDKKLGFALSITATLRGRSWYTAELHDLGAYKAIAGESSDSDDDDLEIVDVAEAVKRFQFRLYLPARVPTDSEMEIQVNPSGTWAGVSFERDDFQWRLQIQERPVEALAEEDLDEWEPMRGNLQDSWIWDKSSDHSEPGRRWLVVRTDRTLVSLYSTLPRHLLVEVAASLKPALSAHL
jgi:hypothetical protein